jgi:hypothetical protein
MLRVNSLVGFGASRPAAAGGFALDYLFSDDNATNQSTYTFNGSFGDAASDRIIIVGVGFTIGISGRSISSVTVGGNTMTQRVASEPSPYGRCYIYTYNLTSGTSGDVVVNMSGGSSLGTCAVCVWRMVGQSDEDPGTSGSEVTTSASAITLGNSLTIPAGGGAVGFTTMTGKSGRTYRTVHNAGSSTTAGTATRTSTYDGASSITWTNLTQDASALQSVAIDTDRTAMVLAAWSP